jgi:integrase
LYRSVYQGGDRASVTGRWHDSRYTLVTELAESGARDETIMAIAGHVSRQMLSRYAHIRTEAKRGALEDVDRKRMAARAQSLENRQTQAAAEAQAAARIQ